MNKRYALPLVNRQPDVACGRLRHSSTAQTQEKPIVQIPQPGVPRS